MTQSFEENINDNFEAAKSAIANCAPITLVQTVNGKQNAITSSNKLSADLISDGTTNKTVNATEKNTWNNKLDSSAISDMATKTWVGEQGYTSNKGTITGITMNGSSKGTSGVVDLGTVITEHQDISGKVNVSDIATTVNAQSTNRVPVGAKLFYDTVGDIESVLDAIIAGN